MFRGLAANAAHGDALNLSPLGEVRQLGRNEVPSARWRLSSGCRGRQDGFGVDFDVVFADASAGARTLDFVNVDTDFASQATGVRRGGNWSAVLGSGHLAQLHGHGKCRGTRTRLIGRQSLFFGLSFGTNCRLESEPRSMLSGDMLDGTARRTSGFGLRR